MSHEKLFKVINNIGYELPKNIGFRGLYLYNFQYERVINEREIIFTPLFISSLRSYLLKKYSAELVIEKLNKILINLNSPINYIYNLLEEYSK